MEFQFKPNIKIVVDFEKGEVVRVEGWGSKVDGIHTIEDIKLYPSSESGIMVKISGYDGWLDSGWLTKIPTNNASPNPL